MKLLTKGSKSEFQKKLMELGLYPENVPPVFRVDNFYNVANRNNLLDSILYVRDKPAELVRHNQSKRGGQRRIFSIPNPVFFIDAARYFHKHRRFLDSKLRSSNISSSVPKIDDRGNRFIKISTHAEFTSRRRMKLALSKYIVKTDASRYYHSVYTHSIPWAMHGKSASKADRKMKSTNIFGNELDFIVRQSQDQQTIGIPVGPDTSRIISELIMSSVDFEFLRICNRQVTASRLVDDMYIGAQSRDEAEFLLSCYRQALRLFELEINENKTHIFEASRDLEHFWPVAIRREIESFAELGGKAESDFVYYTDEILRLTNENNDDGIIKYAIRKMDDFKIWNLYWLSAEQFLVRAIVNFPHCWDYTARVISWRNRTASIDARRWAQICRMSIEQNARNGNDAEVAWALWLMKEIDANVDKSHCDIILDKCGSLPCLILLDLEHSGKIRGKFPRGKLYDRLGKKPMLGPDWLLSYEAERLFGYKLKGKNSDGYECFRTLIDGAASFYDYNALPSVFHGVQDLSTVQEALEDRIGQYEEDEDTEINWDFLDELLRKDPF